AAAAPGRGAGGRHSGWAHRVPDRAGGIREPRHAQRRHRAAAAPERGRQGAGGVGARAAAAGPGARGHRVSSRLDFGSFAEHYDRLLVPAMFGPLAEAVAGAVEAASGDRALDVACGTGALTRLLAERVMSGGEVIALDLAEGMLVAARAPGGEGV